MRHRSLPFAAIAAIVVFIAACSDDDGNASDTTSAAPSTTQAQWTQTGTGEVDTTTSTPVGTSSSPPVTTSSPTTSPPTTADKTTTTLVSDEAASKAAIKKLIVDERAAYVNSLFHPNSKKAERQLREMYAESWVETALGNLRKVRQRGWVARPHPTVPESAVVEGDVALLDGPPATRARVTECTVSSAILVEPGAGPNGENIVVNDQIVARRAIATLVLERGRWRMSGRDEVGEWLGESCPVA